MKRKHKWKLKLLPGPKKIEAHDKTEFNDSLTGNND